MCNICLALKKKQHVVYEDGVCAVCYEPQGVVKGHLKVYPKEHVTRLADLPKKVAIHLFEVAGSVASLVFEALQAQGTNIICNDSLFNSHLALHVLPRFTDDGLKLMWEPKPATRELFDEVEKKLKPHVQYIGVEGTFEEQSQTQHPEKSPDSGHSHAVSPHHEKKETHPKTPEDVTDQEINYLLRQIDRIP